MTTRDEQSEWKTEDVEVAKPVGTVISVRFPAHVAERIFDEAERRGTPVSVVVREAVERHLEGWSAAAALDITISSSSAPVTLVTGRSTHGRSVGAPLAFVGDREYQLPLDAR